MNTKLAFQRILDRQVGVTWGGKKSRRSLEKRWKRIAERIESGQKDTHSVYLVLIRRRERFTIDKVGETGGGNRLFAYPAISRLEINIIETAELSWNVALSSATRRNARVLEIRCEHRPGSIRLHTMHTEVKDLQRIYERSTKDCSLDLLVHWITKVELIVATFSVIVLTFGNFYIPTRADLSCCLQSPRGANDFRCSWGFSMFFPFLRVAQGFDTYATHGSSVFFFGFQTFVSSHRTRLNVNRAYVTGTLIVQ